MWPFNRRKKTDNVSPSVPPEVQEYYQAEHRERVGVAWLIAFVTLVVTVAIVFGLFVGGRWAYRKIVHNNNTTTTISQTTSKTTSHASQQAPASKPSSSTTNKTTPSQTSSNPQPSTPSTTPGAQSTTSTPPSASTSTTTTPTASQQASSHDLANTGPGNTIGVFLAVSTLAAIGHASMTRRKIAKR